MSLIKKALILILAFFVLDCLISIPLFWLSDISMIRYSRLYNETINADVVFIGNSRAVNSFYAPFFTELSNKKSINLAYNGLTLPVAKVFLDDYLQRNQPPKIIFVEVTCLQDDYASLPNFKQYSLRSPGLKKLLKEHYPAIYQASIISKSYLFNSEYFLRTLYYLNKSDQTWVNRYSIRENYYRRMQGGGDLAILAMIGEPAMHMFTGMIKEYSELGITIIPVLAPIIDKGRNTKAVRVYLSDFEHRSKLKVVDLSALIDDRRMFADAIHTNDKGAYVIANELTRLSEGRALAGDKL